jgi:hypothetical protein
MDLLFSKYASPFLLLDEVLSLGRLREFVYSVAKIENENKLWQIYIALVSNPYADVESFDDFKRKHIAPMINTKVDLEATVKSSFDIMQNFKP